MPSTVTVVSNLLVKLGDLVLQEANYLDGVGKELKRLHTEMKWMKCFLKDAAAARGYQKEVVAAWVAEVRELAYEAEDITDTFHIKAPSKRRGSILKEDWWLHMMGKKMDELTNDIALLKRRAQTYGIGIQLAANDGESPARRLPLQETCSIEIEKDLVGFEDYKERLLAVLLDREGHKVVVIAGMGGLGKTTLAKKVFHHRAIGGHFEQFAWVHISQQYQPRHIWEQILLSLESPEKKRRHEILSSTDRWLQEQIRQNLQSKRCLVVLDNVWSNECWNTLRATFLRDLLGNLSRILITSRHETVAQGDYRFLLTPACLNPEQSWELLHKIVFPSSRREGAGRNTEVGLARQMVGYCGGLPFAIRLLGGLLAASSTEWSTIQNNIGSLIARGRNQGQENTGIRSILATNYEDLPAQLKACFIYMAQFPEDYEISVDKLEKMWIAEDMVQPVQDHQELRQEELEDTAKSYMNHLIQRGMVLAVKRGPDNELETCRLLDLTRDFCLSKVKEENMLQVLNQTVKDDRLGAHSNSEIGNVRRLAVHELDSLYPNRHLRSLWFFSDNLDEFFPSSAEAWKSFLPCREFLSFLTNEYKLLRVLDLDGVPLVSITLLSEIGELFLLKMLTFGNITVMKLPSSLGKLRCLQTLDLKRAAGLCWLPNVLWKLEQLRHLHLPCSYRVLKFKIGRWRNLRTLRNFLIRQRGEAESLGELTQLRELAVVIHKNDLTQHLLEDLSRALVNLRNLRSLSMAIRYIRASGGQSIDLTPILSALRGCPSVRKLELSGGRCWIKFPEDAQLFPATITHLALSGWCFNQSLFSKLGEFPNLRFLTLACLLEARQLRCTQGFHQLVFLALDGLLDLYEFIIDREAMPRLERMEISYCRGLERAPEGLRFIESLQELKIIAMPKAFNERLAPGGADCEGVERIPSVLLIDPR